MSVIYNAKDLPSLREAAYAFLKKKRVSHVQGCEKEAVALAEKYGADPEKAAVAAILHDITKALDLRNQLILCDRYGIICDDIEKNSVSLLHSKTGAARARDLFDIEQSVYDAIWWHTTAKPEMSLLEKVIYMADYIEPTRDFEGIDKLRKAAARDLDSAMALGLKMSIIDIRSRGLPLHHNTADAYDYYKEYLS